MFLLKIIKTFIDGQREENKYIQSIDEGEGPIYHRTYWVDIIDPKISPLTIMKAFKKDPNILCPKGVSRFKKIKGSQRTMRINDEFMAHLFGPWNAPTRVVEHNLYGFKFLTLNGNMEAGEINFYLKKVENHWRFTIESLARSKDDLIDLLYDKIPVIKMGQTQMWNHVCAKFAYLCLLDDSFEVKIQTERREYTRRSSLKQIHSI